MLALRPGLSCAWNFSAMVARMQIAVPTCTARATVAVGRWCEDLRMRGKKGSKATEESCTPAYLQSNTLLTLEYTFTIVHLLYTNDNNRFSYDGLGSYAQIWCIAARFVNLCKADFVAVNCARAKAIASNAKVRDARDPSDRADPPPPPNKRWASHRDT